MEGKLSSTSIINTSSSIFGRFPPGFRFYPSDEELIVYYLQNKVTSRPLPASIVAEIDLYKYNPWELPKKALFGEGEWYFFSPRDRKYPKGDRPNRAAGLGYWKATGTDKPIFSSSGLFKPIGVKKSLVFYAGRPPKGDKTDWLMSEYRLLDSSINKPPRFKGLSSMRLDDWVLCRIKCKGNMSKNTREIQDGQSSTEPVRCLQEVEQSTFARANRDTMITDYIHKDCMMLAWMLSGQPVTPMETIPSVDFNEGNNINNGNSVISFSENGSSKVNNSQITTLSSVDNYFEFLNKETSEEDDKEYQDLSKKKNEDDINVPSSNIILAETDNIHGYIQNQSHQGYIFNANQMDSFIEFQELNELALTGKFF